MTTLRIFAGNLREMSEVSEVNEASEMSEVRELSEMSEMGERTQTSIKTVGFGHSFWKLFGTRFSNIQ